MHQGLERWMEWHHFNGLGEVRGRLSTSGLEDPEAVERANLSARFRAGRSEPRRRSSGDADKARI
jgi:hypothetical protein